VGRRNVDVNKSWLCDEGRLSFHTLEKWPRLRHAIVSGERKAVPDLLPGIHAKFESIRKEHGDDAVGALGSANNTTEALFLLKKYFRGRVDFRLSNETELYQQRQDDLLRRLDKHANTHGALDLRLKGDLNGLSGLRERAERKQIRAAWISFHPQLVGQDSHEVIAELEKLISALEFSVVSTTHDFEWARAASMVLPMAAWAEENGTYTNYAGRLQITNRGVMPPGDAQPLHAMIAEMLSLAGDPVSKIPGEIFQSLGAEIPGYAGLDYDSVGLLGILPAQTPEEVLR
jgi:predicted molibdopterin-dependent oxidoreductase YjgC